ncbi:mitochondrial 54S ribosomal protein mL58 [Drepanopeziza brunnea f. sp. 'multigermtubi']|uniref:60S ribosomal protein L20 n=1 Tax=Marssonina brunnea f. sp. multigermtubi (strain MB_m1) TaxID=1072389 RepID=K1WYL1_MARBU|nr:uncharacterized protein MBM_07899 [Drepanopeziza brunnea f. sp. 'multigermtubi' MB_m1]EKD13698.1 hypothetical protein MBM_07899 [Drepanopeziza brunnea f. sp. 'multigermtubi' MB_m1]KAJ5041128.1 hypothetical protein L3040_005681 [Drepanopeziza brunnea f. sp. 'multigermtubi']
MDTRLFRRPALDLLAGRGQCLLSLNASSRRQQSSYRRSKQRMNIKPDQSFVLSNESPRQDHIIFNPPSSAPSVYHTPLKFLPKDDKRRQLLATTASRLQPAKTELPPKVRPNGNHLPHHHLKEADIEEIYKLHRKDPEAWGCNKLARKFNCSPFFISILLKESGVDDTKRKEERAAKRQAVMDAWGPRRRKAMEDRDKRFDLALMGQ